MSPRDTFKGGMYVLPPKFTKPTFWVIISSRRNNLSLTWRDSPTCCRPLSPRNFIEG